MVSGLAPDSEALTRIVGISAEGNAATGNFVQPIPPVIMTASHNNITAIGRDKLLSINLII